MENQDNGQIAVKNEQSFQILKKEFGFDMVPHEGNLDLEDKNRYTKLPLDSEQRMYISALLQNLPLASAADKMSKVYTVTFPEGLPHTLTTLNQGGVGSMIRGEDGKIAGSASFYELTSQAAILNVFTAMSVATGQYFLAEINNELGMMKQKLDKILEFLYGDKKAELMAEVSFIKYAHQNFSSIMQHEAQNIATITSLQEARKVAIKDIEFYLSDLDSTVSSEIKFYPDLLSIIEKSFQIKDSLELSIQLYIMSTILELYYAQNHDAGYLHNLENTILLYINKCDKRILSDFSIINSRLIDYKPILLEKIDKTEPSKRLGSLIDQMNNGEESGNRKTIRAAFQIPKTKNVYYLTDNGSVYLQAE